MRTLIALAALLASATGAYAYCPSLPDDARTSYSQNGVNRAVCLQNELARSQAERAYQTEMDLRLEQLRRDALEQRMQLQQLQQLQMFDTPTYRPPGL